MKAEARVRFETAKEYEIIKRAAKSEKRSISQFIALAAVDAAKATLALQKYPPASVPSQEAAS